jgi:hypothetical protein
MLLKLAGYAGKLCWLCWMAMLAMLSMLPGCGGKVVWKVLLANAGWLALFLKLHGSLCWV